MSQTQEEINKITNEKRKLDNNENDTHLSKKSCTSENQTDDSGKEANADLTSTTETIEGSCDEKTKEAPIYCKTQEYKKSCRSENQTDDNGKETNADSTSTTETNEGSCDGNTKDTPIYFNGQDINTLSKSQMKKYKKMLSWEATKSKKRKEERLRAKQRIAEAKKNNIDLGPSRKQLKQRKMCDSPCKTGVIIDLSFDDLMIPKDLGKVIKQILRVYTENRRSETPMQLHLSSFEGKSKLQMEKHDGYEHWDINFHEENYIDVFPKEKLVYLSSESDNVIKELEQDKFYIIGGLVDHNAHKGLCYKKAVEQGIQHGQLPISEFFTVKTRKVFTINQVFEILLRVSEGLTFKEAFEKVLPQRINMVPANKDE